MLESLQLILGFLGLASLLLFFLIEIYISIFQAEKLRQLIVSQPEYNPGWYMLVTSYKPFKWWHFYRRGLFSILLHWTFIGGIDSDSKCESVTAKVLPKFTRYLYAIEMYSGLVMFGCAILSTILNHL